MYGILRVLRDTGISTKQQNSLFRWQIVCTAGKGPNIHVYRAILMHYMQVMFPVFTENTIKPVIREHQYSQKDSFSPT